MSKLAFIVSGTIVLILSQAAFASPPDVLPEPSATPTEDIQRPIDENMSISDPPPRQGEIGKPSPPRYYPYRQQFTFRGGDSSRLKKNGFGHAVIGFQYLFPKFLSPKLEAGADLHDEGEGHVHMGVRWIFFERSYFRPSLKAALDHRLESKENLATFATLANYYTRLSATLEYVVYNPVSLRLESEMLVGTEDSFAVITLGLSYGW